MTAFNVALILFNPFLNFFYFFLEGGGGEEVEESIFPLFIFYLHCTLFACQPAALQPNLS